MANFPAYTLVPYTQDSEEEIVDDIRIDSAVDGTAHSRAFYSGPKHRFTLHMRLKTAEFSSLWSHYTGNRTATFNFTWIVDGLTYLCLYEQAPRKSGFRGTLTDVTVVLRQQ